MNTNLAPNIEICDHFLECFTGGEDVAFRTFNDQESANTLPIKLYGQLEDVATKLTQENQKGSGVFWVVNKGKGNEQKDVTITRVRALFVDLDGAELDPVIANETKPHIVIESSPGKYHAYWKVNNFPVTEFSRYQKALAARFNGDPVVSNLSRVMRLPGFYHRKDPNNPFMTSVMRNYDQLPYEPDEILEGLNLKLDGPERRHLHAVPSQSGQRIIKNHTRDVTLTQRGASLRNAGYGYEKLLKALLEINAEECEIPLPEKQVDKIARSVSKMSSYADESPDFADGYRTSFGSPKPAKEPTKELGISRFIKNAKQIAETEIKPLEWIIPDVLPQGLTILAGAPKMGKSLLIQQITYAVALGAPTMGRFPTNQGACLHLALEDPDSRFKLRMEAQKLLVHNAEDPEPEDLMVATEWSYWPDAINDIRTWCEQTPNAKMVVVDTLAKLFQDDPKANGRQSVYRSEYQEMTAFHKIAREFGIAIVIIHHLNKGNATDPMNKVSGSAGVTGAADLVWTFERKNRLAMEAKIQSMGKDLPDTIYRLHYDEMHMSWICDDFEGTAQSSKMDTLIMEYFAKTGNKKVTANQVADEIKMSRSHVAKALKELTDKEWLLCHKGEWGSHIFYLNPTII